MSSIYFLIDSDRSHFVPIIEKASNYNTIVKMIPEGMTSRLQPCDKYIIKKMSSENLIKTLLRAEVMCWVLQ